MSQLPDSLPASKPRVVAAIPCFNTAKFIGDVVSRARRYVDQVIVVDDGSHDGTAEVAKAAGALIIKHEANRGYGAAIRSCFGEAKAMDADILVTLDGDGQHNPDELPRVLAPILGGGVDVVIGSRFLGHQNDIPRYRMVGIHIITFLCNLGSRAKVSDAQSGFRAYGRKALRELSLTRNGMSVSVETIVKAREKRLRLKEIAISCLYHSNSSTLNPVLHGVGVALTVVRLRLESWLRRLAGSGGA